MKEKQETFKSITKQVINSTHSNLNVDFKETKKGKQKQIKFNDPTTL